MEKLAKLQKAPVATAKGKKVIAESPRKVEANSVLANPPNTPLPTTVTESFKKLKNLGSMGPGGSSVGSSFLSKSFFELFFGLATGLFLLLSAIDFNEVSKTEMAILEMRWSLER